MTGLQAVEPAVRVGVRQARALVFAATTGVIWSAAMFALDDGEGAAGRGALGALLAVCAVMAGGRLFFGSAGPGERPAHLVLPTSLQERARRAGLRLVCASVALAVVPVAALLLLGATWTPPGAAAGVALLGVVAAGPAAARLLLGDRAPGLIAVWRPWLVALLVILAMGGVLAVGDVIAATMLGLAGVVLWAWGGPAHLVDGPAPATSAGGAWLPRLRYATPERALLGAVVLRLGAFTLGCVALVLVAWALPAVGAFRTPALEILVELPRTWAAFAPVLLVAAGTAWEAPGPGRLLPVSLRSRQRADLMGRVLGGSIALVGVMLLPGVAPAPSTLGWLGFALVSVEVAGFALASARLPARAQWLRTHVTLGLAAVAVGFALGPPIHFWLLHETLGWHPYAAAQHAAVGWPLADLMVGVVARVAAVFAFGCLGFRRLRPAEVS